MVAFLLASATLGIFLKIEKNSKGFILGLPIYDW
jgi:hypothetical protein